MTERNNNNSSRSSSSNMGNPRTIALRNKKFEASTAKGNTPKTAKKEEDGLGVGPIVVGFILFVVIGSSILQLVRSNL